MWDGEGKGNWCFIWSHQLRLYHSQERDPVNKCHIKRKNMGFTDMNLCLICTK